MISEEKVLGRLPAWARVLIIGSVLWLLVVVSALITKNPSLLPSVIIIGSFLIPVTFVVWVTTRSAGAATQLDMGILFRAFVVSGCTAVAVSAILEWWLLSAETAWFYLGVAAVEELSKAAVLVILATRLTTFLLRDGMILGATVGVGFAAFESAGYAFNTIWANQTLDVSAVVGNELMRGILVPFGHCLWTALIGGAIFASARNGRMRMTWPVAGWILAAVLIHTAWDLAAAVGVAAADMASGEQVVWQPILTGEAPSPNTGVSTTVSWIVVALNAALGIALYRWMWKREGADPISMEERISVHTGSDKPA